MENAAFNITLNIDSMIKIQDIMLISSVGQKVPWGPPYNLDDAPGGRFIIPGQTVEIYREDDLVIIKSDITDEQIVVS